jgi:hypothetical protein
LPLGAGGIQPLRRISFHARSFGVCLTTALQLSSWLSKSQPLTAFLKSGDYPGGFHPNAASGLKFVAVSKAHFNAQNKKDDWLRDERRTQSSINQKIISVLK